VRTVAGFAYLLLLGLALRRERFALTLLVAHVAVNSRASFLGFDPNHWITLAGCVALGGLGVFTIARFGLVTTLAAHFTSFVINCMPVTLTPEAWYAGVTMTSVGVLMALAVYGFFVALGGQKLLPDHV
jgi:hypothetical protein